jgi:uncharacterized protein YbaP (TraB family)
MIARALALLAALLLTACGGSGQPAVEDPPPAPALWEIEDGSGQRGWLFGTIHALPADSRWRTPPLDDALGAAGVLVLEVPNLRDTAAIQRAFADLSRTPGLGPVSARVGTADASAVRAALARAGLEDARLGSLETWAVALSLNTATTPAGESVDRQLLAKWGERPVVGLETIEAQLGAFDTLPAPEQAELLVAVVEETARPQERAALAEAWRVGNTAAIEALTSTGALARPALREALLTGRNRVWAERIAPLVAAGRAPFVAVGAGHVVGPDGLPTLLAERGMRVRRVQ